MDPNKNLKYFFINNNTIEILKYYSLKGTFTKLICQILFFLHWINTVNKLSIHIWSKNKNISGMFFHCSSGYYLLHIRGAKTNLTDKQRLHMHEIEEKKVRVCIIMDS